MPLFNHPDFFTHRELDLENKLILPTAKLYNQAVFQLNALYQDIRSVLIDTHSVIAAAAKQVYAHPVETLTAWYDQSVQTGTVLYAQAQATALPVYQGWQVKFNVGREKAGQYLQAFWDNPEQAAATAFEPVSRYATGAAEKSTLYWQAFSDNPEQFMASAFAPVSHYLASLTEEAEALLLGSYYALVDLSGLLMAQPSATFQALYRNTLSALLDVYFDVISSLLVIA